MTLNGAIEWVRNQKVFVNTDEADAKIVAIQALEEIQQYRAIGLTPELIEAMQGHNIAMINDLEAYQTIGTVEELQALKEKSVAKKPIDISAVRDCDGYIGYIGKCPCCEDIVEEGTLYCDCGQHLDW